MKKTKIPGVIDADAISFFPNQNKLSKFVITPHSREFQILTREKPSKNLTQRKKQVKNLAKN